MSCARNLQNHHAILPLRQIVTSGFGIVLLVLLTGCETTKKETSQTYEVAIITTPPGAQCILDGYANRYYVSSPGQMHIPEDYKNLQIVCSKEGYEEVWDNWYPGSDVEMPQIAWVKTLVKKK